MKRVLLTVWLVVRMSDSRVHAALLHRWLTNTSPPEIPQLGSLDGLSFHPMASAPSQRADARATRGLSPVNPACSARRHTGFVTPSKGMPQRCDCSQSLSEQEEIVMTCVLIPVDGSDNSTRALD
jgi:hypothetical protein